MEGHFCVSDFAKDELYSGEFYPFTPPGTDPVFAFAWGRNVIAQFSLFCSFGHNSCCRQSYVVHPPILSWA